MVTKLKMAVTQYKKLTTVLAVFIFSLHEADDLYHMGNTLPECTSCQLLYIAYIGTA
jgi:hypothetical protein